jgi:hypothetical protein
VRYALRNTVRFRLRQRAHVRVFVIELMPRCRLVGSYVVQGKRGRNLHKLHRGLKARPLRAGVYQFVGISDGAKVFSIRVRLNRERQFVRVPVRDDSYDACLASHATEFANAFGVGAPRSTNTGGALANSSLQGAFTPPVTRHRPWLAASPIIQALNPINASGWQRLLLCILLTFSIALLLTASVPLRALPGGAVGAVVFRNRIYVIGAGIALLVTVAMINTS